MSDFWFSFWASLVLAVVGLVTFCHFRNMRRFYGRHPEDKE